MSSCLFWSAVDEYGDNPTGRAGNFEFRIWYEIDYGDDALCEPAVTITNIECVAMQFDEEESRSPNVDEDIELSEWLENSLNSNNTDLRGIERMAFEYSYVELADVDWLD